MSKKTIAVILAVFMLAAVLAACGNTTPAPSGDDKPAPSNNTPADNGKKEEEKKDEEPAKQEYTQTYALKYSSYAPEGHPTNVNTEVPLKEFIEKA